MPKREVTPIVATKVRGVINTLDEAKWKGTPREYALLSRAANILATAIGARSVLTFKPKGSKKAKKRTRRPKPAEASE